MIDLFSTESEGEKKKVRVTDQDLDDDEAVYKRHVLRVIDTKSMRDTAPIRVSDIIRKNEVRDGLFTLVRN